MDVLEEELVKKLIDETPNAPKRVLQNMKTNLDKSISRKTLNRIAKKYNLKWKGIIKSIKSKRNEQEFFKAQTEINNFEAQANECEVYDFDAAGFDLNPSISDTWQETGSHNTLTVPSSKRINVLGFLNQYPKPKLSSKHY